MSKFAGALTDPLVELFCAPAGLRSPPGSCTATAGSCHPWLAHHPSLIICVRAAQAVLNRFPPRQTAAADLVTAV